MKLLNKKRIFLLLVASLVLPIFFFGNAYALQPDEDLYPSNELYPDEILTANFSASSFSGKSPLTVKYTDLSTGTVDAWAWDFNNDGIIDSTEQNPTHTYSHHGDYTATLTVSNDGGSSTYSLPTPIHVILPGSESNIDFGADDIVGDYWPLYLIMIFVAVAAMLFIPTIGILNKTSGQRRGRSVKPSFVVEAIIILVISLILVIFGAVLMNVFWSL